MTPSRPDQGGTVSEATGSPRAYFRNLDIRARDKIVVWRSGLGVTPFIRIFAAGTVSYIDTDDATGKPRVKRAGNCRIQQLLDRVRRADPGRPRHGRRGAPADRLARKTN